MEDESRQLVGDVAKRTKTVARGPIGKLPSWVHKIPLRQVIWLRGILAYYLAVDLSLILVLFLLFLLTSNINDQNMTSIFSRRKQCECLVIMVKRLKDRWETSVHQRMSERRPAFIFDNKLM